MVRQIRPQAVGFKQLAKMKCYKIGALNIVRLCFAQQSAVRYENGLNNRVNHLIAYISHFWITGGVVRLLLYLVRVHSA